MIENDGWRVGVLYESPLSESLRLVIGRRLGGRLREYVTGIDPVGGVTFLRVEEGAEVPPPIDVPTDLARALLDSLSQHFGGTGDTRQLRKDHDAERARVDKLIATLCEVAVRGQSCP